MSSTAIRIRKLSMLFLICLLVFVAGQWVGRQFEVDSPPTPQEVTPPEPHASDSGFEPLDWLPAQAARAGIRLVNSPDPHSVMFVHPESPCWVDVPRSFPSAAAPVESSSPSDFLGADACQDCHAEIYETYRQTGHFQSSAKATAEAIEGSFRPGENLLATNHPDLSFEMVQEDGKFYQSVHFRQLSKHTMQIITGSGHIGQTYLYWVGNSLYELPVSYFRQIDDWANSPGYHDGTAWFARPVISKCLECHTTYVESDPRTENSYFPSSLILGISCERCHGPGKQHVEYHRANPDSSEGQHIANPVELNAKQNNDLCTQCHFGSGNRHANLPFSFRPGDALEDHFAVQNETQEEQGGVHSSNQLARLEKSACFQASESLTCVDCHNPHADERGDIKLFSDRCLKCHQAEHCMSSRKLEKASPKTVSTAICRWDRIRTWSSTVATRFAFHCCETTTSACCHKRTRARRVQRMHSIVNSMRQKS